MHTTRPARNPMIDSDTRLLSGEASNLYGGFGDIPNLDEPGKVFMPGDIFEQPHWTAWDRYGPHKATAARRNLAYDGKTSDGLYHYLDKLTGDRYSIPTHAEWDRYVVEDTDLEVRLGPRRKMWMRIIFAFWGLCLFGMFIGVMLATNSARAATGTPDAVLHAFMLVALFGTPVLFLVRHLSRPAARALPEHRMYYTDFELLKIAEQTRREERRAVGIFAGVMGAFALHRIFKHFGDDDDD